MLIGYARVSTQDQNPDLQLDALKKAGCEEIFQEKFSGKSAARPELENCLRMLRKGDVLVVWRLDRHRLGRSLKDLVEIVSALEDRGVGFQSLTENIDTVSAGGKLVFHIFGALAEFRAQPDSGTDHGRSGCRQGQGAERWTKAQHVQGRCPQGRRYAQGSAND